MATHHKSAAAVCEWVIAVRFLVWCSWFEFVFDFYIFSMVYDIRPAVRTTRYYRKKHHMEDDPIEPADVMGEQKI
jgi:hypothetical protein